MAACAVGRIDELGVDVEPPHDGDFTLELARTQFAPAEAALVGSLQPPARGVAFSRIWTLKEAYLKAIGDGLGVPPDRFAFTLDPVTIRFFLHTAEHSGCWQFYEHDLAG